MGGVVASAAVAAQIVFILLFGLICVGVGVAMYLLNGFALRRMAKSCGLRHPWLGFFPFANLYLMGQLAECNPRPGKKSWPWRHILLVGEIVVFAAMLVVYVWMFGNMISAGVLDNPDSYGAYDLYNLYASMAGALSIMSILSMAYSVAVYIVYWKIYSLFAPDLAVVFLVLTILLSVSPILLFVIRKRQPVVKAPPTNTYWQ